MMRDDHATVFSRIKSLETQVEEDLLRLVAIPSIAGHADACRAAALATAELCEAAGFRAEVWEGPGAPAVFAEIDGSAGSPTVLFYGHYDVQPVEPLESWTNPPFEPAIRGGALFGRGAGDNKGQFLAHIAAVGALEDTIGCPIAVKLLIEGEEEAGSPHLDDLVAANRKRLDCDLAITADGPYHPDGTPLIIFGVRGLLYLQASTQGADRDLHSGSNGGVAPAPARRLVRALAAMWNEDGSIAVPGFYDDIAPPSPAEADLAARLPTPPSGDRGDRTEGRQGSPWHRLMFEPNVNIAGVTSGYDGVGVKTVIPYRADAKIDVRLVANQDPGNVYECLQRFLAPRGVRVERLAAVPPSCTPIDTPFAEAVQRAVEAAWNTPPHLQPRLGGTTPDFVFTRTLAVPSLLIPYAPADMRHHAPDERLPLEALHRGVRTSAAICLELSALSGPSTGAAER